MKRVVVTGASGFIGSNLTRRLLGDGHEIHLFLRRAYQPWRLGEILDHVRCHEITLEDRETVSQSIREIRPDWVFNLAAFGAYSWQVGLEPMVATNVLGCASLVEACVKVGVEAFIQAGSSSEYGYKDHATREDELAQPNSHYAITKLAATHYCQLAARDHGLNIITVRLYSIYGPYEEPSRLIPTLAVYGLRGKLPPLVSPSIARDFIHVDDAIAAMLLLITERSIKLETLYNICSGTQNTIETLVAIARDTLNIAEQPLWSTMKPRSWDTNIWLGSPGLITRQVGWHPALNLELGFRKTVDWLVENPKVLEFYSNRLFG